MDNHAISNDTVADVLSFFAHVVLILGLLGAGAFLFLSGSEITVGRVVMSTAIAVGAVSASFPMLAISRILEKVSAYSPRDAQATPEEAEPRSPVVQATTKRPIPATEEEMGRAYAEYLAEMDARRAAKK